MLDLPGVHYAAKISVMLHQEKKQLSITVLSTTYQPYKRSEDKLQHKR